MANIGELCKFLASNEDFSILCQDTEKSAEQIIENAFQNEEFITKLRNIVQDDNVIKNKMSVIIGQKRKQTKKTDKNKSEEKEDTTEVEDENMIVKYKCDPTNLLNVIYLDKAYIEPVEHRIRLVTTDYEMYY